MRCRDQSWCRWQPWGAEAAATPHLPGLGPVDTVSEVTCHVPRVQRVHSVTCPMCPPLQVPGEVPLAAALPQAALPGGRGPAAVLLQPRPRPGVPRPLPASPPHRGHSRHSWHEVTQPRQDLLYLNVVITSVCLGIFDIPMLLTSPNVTLTDTSSKSTSGRGGEGRCVVIHV